MNEKIIIAILIVIIIFIGSLFTRDYFRITEFKRNIQQYREQIEDSKAKARELTRELTKYKEEFERTIRIIEEVENGISGAEEEIGDNIGEVGQLIRIVDEIIGAFKEIRESIQSIDDL
jgi:chromosome segregation ATPase